jgi:hypothetical protein
MDTLKMPPMLTHSGKFRAHHAMSRTRSARTMGAVNQTIRNLDEGKSYGPKYCSSHKQGLKAWNRDQPVETETFSPTIAKTMAKQTKIGWRNLLEGFPAKRWAHHQEAYLKQIESKCSSRRWKAAGKEASRSNLANVGPQELRE